MFNLHQTSYVWLKCFPEDIYMPISTYSHSATSWQQEVWHIYMILIYSFYIFLFKCILLTVPCLSEAPLAVSPGARSLSSLLAALIRDRAPMVRGPYWICSVLLLLLLLFLFFFSKPNRIFEGLNMLEKSRNFVHTSELAKIDIWYVSEVGVAKWLDSATYTLSTECASSYVSRTCIKVGTLM